MTEGAKQYLPPTCFRPGGDVFARWKDDVLTGKPARFFPVGSGGLGRLEIGPGRIVVIGGQPGLGKSALVMQMVFDALIREPRLTALVASVEMASDVLLDRQLARLSGIDLSKIQGRRLEVGDGAAIGRGLEIIAGLVDRLAFMEPPFLLDDVGLAANNDDFLADLIVLDYLQRIPAPGKHADQRASVNATLSYLREFATAGFAVLAVSSVSRQKNVRGKSSYDDLDLASFGESSGIEYNCDDAFILTADPDDQRTGALTLRHLKSRHGRLQDVPLMFDGSTQQFSDRATGPAGGPSKTTTTTQADLMERIRRAHGQNGTGGQLQP